MFCALRSIERLSLTHIYALVCIWGVGLFLFPLLLGGVLTRSACVNTWSGSIYFMFFFPLEFHIVSFIHAEFQSMIPCKNVFALMAYRGLCLSPFDTSRPPGAQHVVVTHVVGGLRSGRG